MSRLRQDKRRLALENYPLRFETRPLYGDVDTNRHVNNVTVARWFEESRAQLNHRVAGAARLLDPSPGLQLLLVSIQIEYLQQVPYPSTVTVAAAVLAFATRLNPFWMLLGGGILGFSGVV